MHEDEDTSSAEEERLRKAVEFFARYPDGPPDGQGESDSGNSDMQGVLDWLLHSDSKASLDGEDDRRRSAEAGANAGAVFAFHQGAQRLGLRSEERWRAVAWAQSSTSLTWTYDAQWP